MIIFFVTFCHHVFHLSRADQGLFVVLPVVKIAKRDRGERSDGKGEEKWTLGMRQDNIKHGGDYTNFANYQADVDADAEGDVESDYRCGCRHSLSDECKDLSLREE